MKTKEQELFEAIKGFNSAYRSGESTISDDLYNRYVEELRSLNPNHEWFKRKEPGIAVIGRIEKLPIQMRSLQKLKSFEELQKWLSKVPFGEDKNVVIMPKLDGNSALVNEFDYKAWTRGGEDNEGTIITDHLRFATPINPTLGVNYTGGEVIFPRKVWTEDIEGKINPISGEPFKTMRGTVAGSLQSERKEAIETISKAHFVRYSVFPENIEKTYVRDLELLHSQTDRVVGYQLRNYTTLSEELLNELYNMWNNEYECDGLVVCLNDKELWKELGRHSSTGDPLYSMAYKANFEERFKTKVVSINSEIAKSGYLKPTVEIEPVYIQGAKIDNPTGYNMGWIRDMGLHPGAEIEIIRSGGVIPKITKVLSNSKELAENEIKDIIACGCPDCGGLLVWNESKTDLVCSNKNLCRGVKLAKIIYFFTQLKFEEFGEATIKTIFDFGVTTLLGFVTLKKSTLLDIPGIGETTADNILSQLDNLYENKITMVKLATLMSALDTFEGIGEAKAQKIIDFLPDNVLNKLAEGDASKDLILSCLSDKQKEEKTWISFLDGLYEFYSLMSDLSIPFDIAKTKKVLDGDLEGVAVCFSGVRDEGLEKLIEGRGGKIASGVSKKTTHLVVDDVNSGTSKAVKARELNIPIILIGEAKELWK